MKKLFSLLERELLRAGSGEGLFNQYAFRDPLVDREFAPEIRRNNLRAYVESFHEAPPVLILCEAPGPWGCRFSGVPITSESQLVAGELPFRGEQSSLDQPLVMMKKRPPFSEYSAGIFWGTLARRHPRFFVWNTVPLHPHRPGNIVSIRTPSRGEIARFLGMVRMVMEHMRPSTAIAVGRKAEYAFGLLNIQSTYVRHPAQGGAAEFKRDILRIMEGL